MMKNINSLLNSIHFETSLLESLEWDENKLKDTQDKLSEYFSVCSKRDLDLIKIDLCHVFSDDIAELVYNYLSSMQIELKGEEIEAD